MWLIIRRLAMTFVASWILEAAIRRWPRLSFARRVIGPARHRRV